MLGLEFKNYPNLTTPLDADNLNTMQQELANNILSEVMNNVYPIGRGFIDFTDEDYSDYLGFTWERTLLGVVPVGKDSSQVEFDTLGKTGGAKTHTLTIAEMPSHGHDYRRSSLYSAEWTSGNSYYGQNSSTQGGNNLYQTASSGGGQPHNNLQPYEVVNYWKRVA